MWAAVCWSCGYSETLAGPAAEIIFSQTACPTRDDRASLVTPAARLAPHQPSPFVGVDFTPVGVAHRRRWSVRWPCGRDVPGLPTVLRETAAHSAPDTTLKLSSFHFAMSPW